VRALPPSQRTSLDAAIAANAAAQAKKIAGKGPIIGQAVRKKRLRVVGAVYDIGSGRVSLV
jgi:carbonic anhydrase